MASVAELTRCRSPAAALTNMLAVALVRLFATVPVAPARARMVPSSRLFLTTTPVVPAYRYSIGEGYVPDRDTVLFSTCVSGASATMMPTSPGWLLDR